MEKIHVFEKAGLGKAPFAFVGSYEHHEHAFGSNAGGLIPHGDYGTSCDFCGHYIRNVFLIESSDGKTFRVGSDCVAKTGEKGMINKVRAILNDKRKERERLAREARWEAERPEREAREAKMREEAQARREKLQAEYERVLPLAEKVPHPNGYFASKGKTLKDYILYFQNGSRWHDLNDAPYQVKNALRQVGANI